MVLPQLRSPASAVILGGVVGVVAGTLPLVMSVFLGGVLAFAVVLAPSRASAPAEHPLHVLIAFGTTTAIAFLFR